MAEAGGDPGCGLVEHRNPGRKNPQDSPHNRVECRRHSYTPEVRSVTS